MGADPRTMLFEKLTAFGFRPHTTFSQGCIAQHVPDRHPGRFQTAEKFDPDQDGRIIVPLARSVPVSIGKQPDPLVIANGMGGQPRTLRQFTDLHERPFRHDAHEAKS